MKIDSPYFEFVNFGNCTFHRRHSLVDSHFNQLSVNTAVLENGLSFEKLSLNQYLDFCNNSIHREFYFTEVQIQEQALFNKTKIVAPKVSFYWTFFGAQVDFREAIFDGVTVFENCTFSLESDFSYCSFPNRVNFDKNIVHGDVLFRGKQPYDAYFQNLAAINLETITGTVSFENVNFNKIVLEDREKLIELSWDNKVIIGPGCQKYNVQTDPIKILVSQDNHEVIREFAITFSTFFNHKTLMNLGVEVVEKHPDYLTIFYFSDDNISQEEFLIMLSQQEKEFWLADLDQSDLTALDILISKVALFTKIQSRLAKAKWALNETQGFAKAIHFSDAYPITIENLHLSLVGNQNVKFVSANTMRSRKSSLA